MDLLERMQRHRKEQEKAYIDVPEWGDGTTPLRVYRRSESIEDFGAIAAASDKGWDMALIETLRRLGVDESGEPIFKGIGNVDFKKQASGDVALRVANFLRKTEAIDQKEVEGN